MKQCESLAFKRDITCMCIENTNFVTMIDLKAYIEHSQFFAMCSPEVDAMVVLSYRKLQPKVTTRCPKVATP